ncbi:MAG: alpha/beta hydrolase [Pseudobdellovibrionaceae bacterium]
MVQSSPLSAQTITTTVPVELPMTYLHFNVGEQKPLLILFHGYEDTAAGVMRRSLGDPRLFSEFEILAPNGLFPVPVRVDGGFKQTHAWYFADFSRKQVLIPPQVSAQGVARLIEKLNLQDRPKILIGFSQGGFFLPFVLPGLQNVKKLIGIAGGYRVTDYPQSLSAPVDAFHGSEDKIVPMAGAKEGFEKLGLINPKGQFFTFPGLGHTMNDSSREVLKKQIKEAFQ